MTAKSRAALTTEIATNLADNNTSAITPALERQVCQDSVDSAFNTITDTLTGDVTTTSGSLATTLATVNTNVGTFGSATVVPVVTVNAKGLVTAVTTATISGGGGGSPGGSTTQVQYNNAGAFAGDPTLTFASAVLSSPSHVITSAVTTALAVGANGTTNPALQVDSSTASAATGVKITAAAATGGVNIAVISSNATENITIGGKGATSVIGMAPNGSSRVAFRDYSHTFTVNTNSASSARFSYTGAADTTLVASVEAANWYVNLGQIRQHATGALALQRDFRITGSTHSAVAASTITDCATFSIDGPPTAGTNATITNAHGLYIPDPGFIGVVNNAYGITVNTPTGGGTTNFAMKINGAAFTSVPAVLATVTGINAFTVANTALYTVPTGKTLVVTETIVIVTAASAVTAGPTVGVGNVSGTSNIFTAQATGSTFNAANVIFRFPVGGGISLQTAAGGTVYLNLTTAATGTSETISVHLVGYLY